VLVLCLVMMGCQRSSGSGAEVMLESLHYRVSGGQPAVAADLRLAADGTATLFVGTAWSLPPSVLDRVGTFAGRLDDSEWNDLERIVAESRLLDAQVDANVTSPDPSVRVLTLGHSEGETQLKVTGTDPRTAAIEERLLEVMRGLVAASPQSALSASAAFEISDGMVSPEVILQHQGTEPLPVLLFDEGDPSFFVRLSFVFEREMVTGAGESIWLPVATETVSRDQVARLVADGALPGGVHDMPPQSRYVLSLPPFKVPAAEDPLAIRTRIDLWLPGEGKARRKVTIELERTRPAAQP
jgi:hypothetical protein